MTSRIFSTDARDPKLAMLSEIVYEGAGGEGVDGEGVDGEGASRVFSSGGFFILCKGKQL